MENKHGLVENTTKAIERKEKEMVTEKKNKKTAIYKGKYLNGLKHGSGYLVWENGSCYRGRFKNNMMHDVTGKYVWPDGRSYLGE